MAGNAQIELKLGGIGIDSWPSSVGDPYLKRHSHRYQRRDEAREKAFKANLSRMFISLAANIAVVENVNVVKTLMHDSICGGGIGICLSSSIVGRS
jgi:hypothetical protein